MQVNKAFAKHVSEVENSGILNHAVGKKTRRYKENILDHLILDHILLCERIFVQQMGVKLMRHVSQILCF